VVFNVQMLFRVGSETKEFSVSSLHEIVEDFVQILVVEEQIRDVLVFGGCVREPDKVHSDLDLLVVLDRLPESEELLTRIAAEWGRTVGQIPGLGIIDCFFTDGLSALSFNSSGSTRLFRVIDEPREGGLDDDDDELYIGATRSVQDLE
jgi:hypothetical protein